MEKERKRLEVIKREISAIEAPFPEGGSIALAEEIDELRKSCNQMAKEVEEAGPGYGNWIKSLLCNSKWSTLIQFNRYMLQR